MNSWIAIVQFDNNGLCVQNVYAECRMRDANWLLDEVNLTQPVSVSRRIASTASIVDNTKTNSSVIMEATAILCIEPTTKHWVLNGFNDPNRNGVVYVRVRERSRSRQQWNYFASPSISYALAWSDWMKWYTLWCQRREQRQHYTLVHIIYDREINRF